MTDEVFEMDETVLIIVPGKMRDNDIFLARFLVRELSDRYGIALKIVEEPIIPEGGKTIIMGRYGNPLIRNYCKRNKINITGEKPGKEGYFLEVNSEKIIIAGSDDPGAFYGLQSLRHLISSGDG